MLNLVPGVTLNNCHNEPMQTRVLQKGVSMLSGQSVVPPKGSLARTVSPHVKGKKLTSPGSRSEVAVDSRLAERL